MRDYQYEDVDGDVLRVFIDESEDDYGLCVSVRVHSEGGEEHIVIVDPLDAPRIARALLERAGHKVGGKTFADAAVGALKDHEEVVSGQKELDEKVKKYFKEVRQLNLQSVMEFHREEYRRAEKFNEEVFGRRPKVVAYEERMKADPYVKWRTKEVGPIHFVFEYDHNAGRWDCTASAYGSKREPYDGTLFNLSHSYFPLEEVFDERS